MAYVCCCRSCCSNDTTQRHPQKIEVVVDCSGCYWIWAFFTFSRSPDSLLSRSLGFCFQIFSRPILFQYFSLFFFCFISINKIKNGLLLVITINRDYCIYVSVMTQYHIKKTNSWLMKKTQKKTETIF